MHFNNLYYGWYVGEMEDNDAWFDKFHEEHPDVVIGLTEYGADSTIKLQSPKPEKGDYTEVVKVSEPNPEYFVSADKVRNRFDETEIAEKDGYFSLNSTMGKISANPKGKALLDQMMAVMTAKTAGGMGEGVKASKEMQAIVARQPLKRLLGQVGIDLESDAAKQLNAALNQIKK